MTAVLVETLDSLRVLRLVLLIHRRGHAQQTAQRVSADLLDQHDQGATLGRGQLDQCTPFQEVVGCPRNLIVTRVLAVGVTDDAQLAVSRVVGEMVVDRSMLYRNADDGMFGHIRNAIAAKIDCPSVSQALQVFVSCT